MWDKTAAHFQNKTISLASAARAIRDRYDVGFATTPKFMPSVASSLGEAGLYLRAMQGHFKETKTQYVQILFRELEILLGDFLCVLHAYTVHRRGTNSFQRGIQEI